MECPNVFKYLRPDEVAETWDGVATKRDNGKLDWSLYEALWNSMDGMPELSEQIDIEDSSPQDAIGLNSLHSVWHKFTPEQQQRLIELVKRNEED